MGPYHPLDEDSLRLLHVQHGDDGVIRGELRPFTRASAKSVYTAISYVWGEEASHEPVKVNDCDMHVTRNAHTILKMFCDLPKSKEKTWIWLDSICINQHDAPEKSVQVSRMASTYENAIRVFVWLGDGDEQTDRGMELMRVLALHISGYPIPESILKDAEAWDGYRQIALRPWWSRVWTLQESTIPDDAIYYCGTKCLTGSQLRSAVLYLSDPGPPGPGEMTWLPLWNRRRMYQWVEDSEFVTLPALLAYEGYASASDPRDYIYSLLGCVRRRDKDLVGSPRYDVDFKLIYLHLVKNWILEYQSLDIISFATLFREKLDSLERTLPSFVPNWQERTAARERDSNPIPLLVSQPGNLVIGGLLPPRFARFLQKEWAGCPLYKASGDVPPDITFADDLQSMTCTGIVLGHVEALAAMAGGLNEPMLQSTATTKSPLHTTAENTAMELAKEVLLSITFGRADIYLQYEADVLTIMTEVASILASSDADDDEARDFRDWLELNDSFLIRGRTLGDVIAGTFGDFSPQRLVSHANTSAPTLAGDRPTLHHLSRGEYQSSAPGSPEAKLGKEEDQGLRHPYLRKFKYATHSRWMARRLCVTDRDAIGMVPKDSQPNDLVCILMGCSVPMVLRPTKNDQYLLVGECYLHGLMEGQALEKGYPIKKFAMI